MKTDIPKASTYFSREKIDQRIQTPATLAAEQARPASTAKPPPQSPHPQGPAAGGLALGSSMN